MSPALFTVFTDGPGLATIRPALRATATASPIPSAAPTEPITAQASFYHEVQGAALHFLSGICQKPNVKLLKFYHDCLYTFRAALKEKNNNPQIRKISLLYADRAL